jgi:hypothetical protein
MVVSKRKTATNKQSDRLRAVPWATVLQAVVLAGRRWRSLSKKERTRLRRLVRDSQGMPSNLSLKQRAELRRLIGKLDLRGLAREIAAVTRGGRGRGRRCRRARA